MFKQAILVKLTAKTCLSDGICLWTYSTDPDQTASGQNKVFPVCYSDKHFVNSSPKNQHFI